MAITIYLCANRSVTSNEKKTWCRMKTRAKREFQFPIKLFLVRYYLFLFFWFVLVLNLAKQVHHPAMCRGPHGVRNVQIFSSIGRQRKTVELLTSVMLFTPAARPPCPWLYSHFPTMMLHLCFCHFISARLLGW